MKYILETIFALCTIFIIVSSLLIGSYVLDEKEVSESFQSQEDENPLSCSYGYKCVAWDYKYKCMAWMCVNKYGVTG